MTRAVVICAALSLAAIGTSATGASVGKPGEDAFWKSADYARFAPASIALVPAVSFDRNAENERLVGEAWAASFTRGTYRWLSASTTRALLTSTPAGDSLHTFARTYVLKNVRVDSLLAPRLCARLRVQAVLSVQIYQWDKLEIQADESGKPWSRVQLRAALVDSLGRLLWTGTGSETLEGPNHEPSAPASTRSDASAPRSEFGTGGGTPPPFRDVLMRILTRWSAAFPQHAAAPAPASAPGSTP